MHVNKKNNLRDQLARCITVQWVLGAAALLLVIGFAVICYRPRHNDLLALQAKILTNQKELGANQKRVTTLPAVALEVDRLRVNLENFDKRLPRHPELAEFLKNINQLSQQSSLSRLSVRQEAPRRLELFSEQPIVMRFQGDFSQVWSFLDRMETLARLTRVRNVQIKSVDSKLGTVDVQLALNIYFTGW